MKQRPIAIGLFALATVAAGAGCFVPDEGGLVGKEAARCQAVSDAGEFEDQVLQLVNLERSEAGLPPVIADPTLQKIAADYACSMIEEDFFGHRDPANGYGPGERAVVGRYSFYAIGENLAAGQETPADVMRVWMNSESHRAIILDERWREIGIAVRTGGKYSVYWVQEFGDPTDY